MVRNCLIESSLSVAVEGAVPKSETLIQPLMIHLMEILLFVYAMIPATIAVAALVKIYNTIY